jgi:hypothetical protein
MNATVDRINGSLVVLSPGISKLHLSVDLDLELIRLTCPACRKQTMQFLVEDQEFEIRHRKGCRSERELRRFVEEHPELVGKQPTAIVVSPPDPRSTPRSGAR